MKKTLNITAEKEVLTLVTGMTYARVPAWYNATVEDLKMDIIMPKHREGHAPMPAVIWFCGGAFSVVDRSVWMPEMVEFARRGYVVASVNYRTVNNVSFPAQIKDAKAAVRFLRANAAEFCVDPDRIAVMGESAGGTIATFLGVTANMPMFTEGAYTDVSDEVQAVVDFYGVSDLRSIPMESEDPNVADWAIPAFMGGKTPEKAAAASAVTYVSDCSAPFIILHGSADITVPIASSEVLYDALRAHNIPVEFYTVEGAGHGEDVFYQEPVYDLIDSFLKKTMK